MRVLLTRDDHPPHGLNIIPQPPTLRNFPRSPISHAAGDEGFFFAGRRMRPAGRGFTPLLLPGFAAAEGFFLDVVVVVELVDAEGGGEEEEDEEGRRRGRLLRAGDLADAEDPSPSMPSLPFPPPISAKSQIWWSRCLFPVAKTWPTPRTRRIDMLSALVALTLPR